MALVLLGPILVGPLASTVGARSTLPLSDPVQTKALAVAVTGSGDLVGMAAELSVTVARNGSGHVFIDTRPLAGTDMQGSARMAARVAASLTGFAMENHDFFYVIRSESPTISGPSAGAVMALATVVALEKVHRQPIDAPWNLSEEVMATGTIAPDGSIGPVGGILEKAQAAADAGAKLFAIPEGQGTYRPRQLSPQGVQRGDPVNVSTYCREEIGITCREVGTLEELVEMATGHTFVEPDLGQPPTTAVYDETLGPLSADLIERGSLYQDVWSRLNGSDVSSAARQEILDAIQRAQDALAQAKEHRSQEEFYSAASRAFSASIHSRHADLMLKFFQSGRSLDRVEQFIDRAQEDVRAARQAAGDAAVKGIQDLYAVGAAQERVSDAEQRIDSARQSFNETEVPQALFDTAWAIERAQTVHWWLQLGEAFGPGPEIPVEISTLAGDFIDLASEILAYSSQVLGSQPARAAQTLQQAKKDDERGFYAAAVIEANEAQVQAALALEVQAGTPTPEKVNTSRQAAAQAIQKARARGVEPMLPIAMFEFAAAQEDRANALEFYRTAKVLAGLSSVLTGDSEPTPSRFQGEPDPPDVEHDAQAQVDRSVYRRVAVGWFTIGMFATLALGTLIAAIVRRE